MKIDQVVDSGELSMTSLEVSEVTKKPHYNVLRKIRELSGKGIIRDLPQIEFKYEGANKVGRPAKMCRLNKTESINLVANLCPEFTARIVERWLDLERQVSGQSHYDQLQALSINVKLSEQLGNIGSTLMNKRKQDKQLLKELENHLVAHCQLVIDFGLVH